MRKSFFVTAIISIFAQLSCNDRLSEDFSVPGTLHKAVSVGIAGYAGSSGTGQEGNVLADISVFHFEGGRLLNAYESLYEGAFPATGGVFDLPLETVTGTLYVVAVAPDGPDYVRPQAGDAESEWLNAVVRTGNGRSGIFYTGKTEISSGGHAQVNLKRGVARFDLRMDVAGTAEVRSLSFSNMPYETLLFPGESSPSGEILPGVVSSGDLDIFFDEPLSGDRDGVAYVFGGHSSGLSVSVDAVIDGRECTAAADLPERVERNTIYTLTLRQDSVSGTLDLSVAEWNDGGETVIEPDRDRRLAVDMSASEFPPNVQVSDDRTVIGIPYNETEFILALDSDDEMELLPFEGHLLSVEPYRPAAEGEAAFWDGVNRFIVRKGLYAPDAAACDVVLGFHRKGLAHSYAEDAITLRLSSNPTGMSGVMSFDNENYTHDFGRYADNEFGVLTLPPEKSVSVEFAPGEDEWIKIEPSASGINAFRVLGGWRPNDPTANGREQKAVIVISNIADGSEREEYTVIRRNYGLPVTWFHGVWWCKYNAMGNSRSFEDQILSSDDPAAKAGQTLFDYLSSCSPEEYRELWGWSYLGDSGQGMRVVDNGGIPVLDGYRGGQTVHMNRLPAGALSPDGYELPSMEEFNRIFDATDYVWVMWNGSHQLKNPWNGHSAVTRMQKRKNGIRIGTLELSDLIYIAMSSPDFPEHEPVVWYGPGAQWNAEGIYHNGHYNNILFGVHSPEGAGWFIGGGMENLYLHKNAAGNNDSRILRFKKSDVEYIY